MSSLPGRSRNNTVPSCTQGAEDWLEGMFGVAEATSARSLRPDWESVQRFPL